MDNLFSMLQTALPVFLALGLGMLCRSINFLSRDGIDALKKVVINITLPAVLLSAFATTEYSASTAVLPVSMFLVCCLGLAVGFALVKLFRSKSRLAPFIASGFEAGMLGYALFSLLFPQESLSRFAILDLGQTLFVFTLYKILLCGQKNTKTILRDMVKTPILWAVAVGVLLGATGLYSRLGQAQAVFTGITDFVSAPTAMMILLTVGYELVPRDIPWKKVAGLIALRIAAMAVCLGVLLALNRWVLDGMIFTGAAVLMCILPPPYVIPVFADEPSERVQISSGLSALTFLTVIGFAVYAIIQGLQIP